jgi:hypothetical protein
MACNPDSYERPDRCEVGVGEQREQRLQQTPEVDEVGFDDLG